MASRQILVFRLCRQGMIPGTWLECLRLHWVKFKAKRAIKGKRASQKKNERRIRDMDKCSYLEGTEISIGKKESCLGLSWDVDRKINYAKSSTSR